MAVILPLNISKIRQLAVTTDISTLIHAITTLKTPLPRLSATENTRLSEQLFSAMLPPRYYARDATIVARELLGTVLVRRMSHGESLAAVIVETEAYLPHGDDASHAARGQTRRNGSMFATGGTLYVYKIYGVHHCINAVTEDIGIGSAVLIRAALPFAGIENMQQRRGENTPVTALCRGPGNLAHAFGFTTADDGISLCSSEAFISALPDIPLPDICVSARIGITKSADLSLRFYVGGSPFVSGKRQKKQ